MRAQLVRSLRAHFEQEIDRSLHHIENAMAPYSRFIRAERGKLLEAKEKLSAVRDSITRLKSAAEEI